MAMISARCGQVLENQLKDDMYMCVGSRTSGARRILGTISLPVGRCRMS